MIQGLDGQRVISMHELHSGPYETTIGDAEMFSAVSRAVTMPPRTRENSFSKCSGSASSACELMAASSCAWLGFDSRM